ncbi:NADP-dependent malic enzyme isoform X1 [Cinnamomum micranthum f. kanehirae]|uniref:Malic enzyme n=1 Tax=Cinnamomum micranthum f. kanehirae TaxID=337451 RepID=A0A3S3PVD1_9MAGN|nr:NADP-dependent malic enzyme isoform X1 [Cinnamomum micranthum f. kanehirae]
MSSSESDFVTPPQENPEKPWEADPQSYDEAYQNEYKIHQFDSDLDSDPTYNNSEGNSSSSPEDSEGNSSSSPKDSEGNSSSSPKDSNDAAAIKPKRRRGLDDTSNEDEEDLALIKPKRRRGLDDTSNEDEEDLALIKPKRRRGLDDTSNEDEEDLALIKPKRRRGLDECGYSLLRDPRHNKGLAFSDKERDAYYLRGLLPPTCMTQELQEKKLMHNIRQYEVPLQRYMAMMDLQERNERLFYKLLIDNFEELLPIVYTPTVGEACQKYGSIFTHPRGLYISLKEKGKILEVLRNWPEKNVQVIVVTDGERILGLGDLGCQGMRIPVGKLSLYTALGGLRPSACLPVTIDVGTNNEQLLKDEFYIGLRQKRSTGQEYANLLREFMCAVKQNYGEKVLIQFEAFGNHNAYELLAKYGRTHLVFNDDIQGTASVVLAGLVAALKFVGGTLAENTFLFLGADEAGTGIAELLALELSKQTKHPLEEARKKIWLMDSKGLIVSSRKESLQHLKKPWAHERESIKELLDAVKAIKPTVLIGSSGVGRTFTKEVIEAMASLNEKPIILALSNPTSQSECTAEEAYRWSQGRAIFASGSPFNPVTYNEKTYIPGQANNAYIFPGFGLGLVMSGALRVHDDMLLAASKALARQVTQENFDKGLIYPPFSNIRKISAHIAANVAAKAHELGLTTGLPQPEDLVESAVSCMYSPVY